MSTQLNSLGENQFLAVKDINHPRQDLIIDSDNLVPYKVYTVLLTQKKNNPPTAIVLENNIGNIVWTKDSEGVYRGTLKGAFPDANKFFTLNHKNMVDAQTFIGVKWENVDSFSVRTTKNGLPEDNILDSNPIEIRVYN